MNTQKIIPYARHSITDEDIDAVVKILKGDYLTQGQEVTRFEKLFAEKVGAKYAVAVNSATAALHLSAIVLGVNSKTKVITTPNTFSATANSIRYCDGEVKFVDINPQNFCLDFDLLEKELERCPAGTYSGVIPVDFAGYPMDMERMQKIAQKHKLWIVEDACHAPGAEFKNSKGEWHRTGSGEYADLTIFSFHPAKHIACGEGGMITTNNSNLYEKLQLLKTHGITKNKLKTKKYDGPWYYEMQELGYNYRIPDILCGLGISQLNKLDANINRRREIASIYRRELPFIKWQEDSKNIKNAYHLMVGEFPSRDKFYAHLQENGIYAQVHYIPVTHQPYYQQLNHKNEVWKNVDAYYEKALSLPMYPSLQDFELEKVINTIKSFYESN